MYLVQMWQNQGCTRLKIALIRNWGPNSFRQFQNEGLKLGEWLSQTPTEGLRGGKHWARLDGPCPFEDDGVGQSGLQIRRPTGREIESSLRSQEEPDKRAASIQSQQIWGRSREWAPQGV